MMMLQMTILRIGKIEGGVAMVVVVALSPSWGVVVVVCGVWREEEREQTAESFSFQLSVFRRRSENVSKNCMHYLFIYQPPRST